MNNDWMVGVNEIDDMLGQLPRATPDAARSERIRARCRRKLTHPRSLPPTARSAKLGHRLESAVVGGFCAVYFSGVVFVALRTHGLWRG